MVMLTEASSPGNFLVRKGEYAQFASMRFLITDLYKSITARFPGPPVSRAHFVLE